MVDPTEPLAVSDTAAHLLVCVDGRCAARGSRELHGALWDALEREGIAYYRTGGSVRLTASSCLGACDSGPTIACYSTNPASGTCNSTWFGHQSFDSAMRLARSLHKPS